MFRTLIVLPLLLASCARSSGVARDEDAGNVDAATDVAHSDIDASAPFDASTSFDATAAADGGSSIDAEDTGGWDSGFHGECEEEAPVYLAMLAEALIGYHDSEGPCGEHSSADCGETSTMCTLLGFSTNNAASVMPTVMDWPNSTAWWVPELLGFGPPLLHCSYTVFNEVEPGCDEVHLGETLYRVEALGDDDGDGSLARYGLRIVQDETDYVRIEAEEPENPGE